MGEPPFPEPSLRYVYEDRLFGLNPSGDWVELSVDANGNLVATQSGPVQLQDASGTTIDPAEAFTDPSTVQQQDLIGSGDLTIGPQPVARAQAILIAAHSEGGNTWSASVTWQDGNGNVLNNEVAADLGLENVTDNWARIVRKGPEVSVTFTDTSGAGSNNINAYLAAHG